MEVLNFIGLHYKFNKVQKNSKFFKDKKGMLLASETLKIILAVISIGFLVYLLTAIYFNSGDTKKLEQAEATMERIDLILARFNEANFSGEAVTDINPAGWKVFAFVENENKPNSCSGENCLCICENVVADYFDRQVQRCDDLGVCSIVPNLMEFEEIKIGKPNNPTSLFIGKKGVWVEVTEV
jgi:hypothetical protein